MKYSEPDRTLRTTSLLLTAVLLLAGLASTAQAQVPMFDGKSLAGWEVRQGEEQWWTAADGVIRGGSMETKVPYNTFLATEKSYANYDLSLKIRLVNGSGFVNSGFQMRSIRVPSNSEMSGYQVDAGIGWWGKLYDESRRNKVIAEPVDPAAIAKAAKNWDWNDYRILCEGQRIRTWINGVAALDYTEKDPKIPLEGRIAIQAHGGGKFFVEVKDITIKELPATPGSPVWPKVSPRSPEDQKASFTVPEGFEVELVTSEEQGIGKPITVAWDPEGRLWTMTAFEYPIDANENAPQAEALFAKGGRDKVLVIDEPYGPGPHKPRVFADGLVMPLGMLPLAKGVMVQYGHEIRLYEDKDGDGRAESFQPLLKGFGIQDSHLFPHQFERAPGGWVYMAQGLFNTSNVVRSDGSPFPNKAKSISFTECKLARMKADGSDFELLSGGPNNIWGLGTARDGEVFLQEANDVGIPVAEFIAGTHYASRKSNKIHPYAPVIPPSFPNGKDRMGGTGLSGLAIAEDDGSLFAAPYGGRKVIYVANPITNRIQVITVGRDEAGHLDYRKEKDFLTTTDNWFRPVAIHFGPDGALYVVDWYNKVISHNEVPRTHPDRDKTRGRIWRIKPKGVALVKPVNLAALSPLQLVDQLGGPNARVARMAWQALEDRKDMSVAPKLRELAASSATSLAKRLGAIWSLEGMGALESKLLLALAKDKDPHVRYEAVRAAGDLALDPQTYIALSGPAEKNFRVRCAWANSLRRQAKVTPEMVSAFVKTVAPLAKGKARADYEVNFHRYLTRWALETHWEATQTALANAKDWSSDARTLASLSLPPAAGAVALLKASSSLGRPLTAEELQLLGGQLDQPAVAKAFGELLGNPKMRRGLLESMLQLNPAAAADPALRQVVEGSVRDMVSQDASSLDLAVKLARRFRLPALGPVIHVAVTDGKVGVLDGLRALNEIGAADATLSAKHLNSESPEIAGAAMLGYAMTGGKAAVAAIALQWDELNGPMRQFAVDGMLSNRETAEVFAEAASGGGFDGFAVAAVEKLRAVLGDDHPALKKLMSSLKGLLMPAIRMHAGGGERVLTNITLDGAFTVESWMLLDSGVSNEDNLLGTKKKRGGADFNFFSGKLCLYSDGVNHLVSTRIFEAGIWTHCAVTRDAEGNFAIYMDGELDTSGGQPFKGAFTGLNIGESTPAAGSGAAYLEFRQWDSARSAEQIRQSYRTTFSDGSRPAGLVGRWSGDTANLPLEGGASVEWLSDFPELRSPEEEQARKTKFAKYAAIAKQPGDPAAGRKLVEASCMICHKILGEGVMIGPDLSGAGAMGLDALLGNILYPNDKMESGYYRHDVTLKDGSLVSGFLVSETAAQISIRAIGADERVIARAQIAGHNVSKRSLMPEGLIDGMSEKQVADLLSYLTTLK